MFQLKDNDLVGVGAPLTALVLDQKTNFFRISSNIFNGADFIDLDEIEDGEKSGEEQIVYKNIKNEIVPGSNSPHSDLRSDQQAGPSGHCNDKVKDANISTFHKPSIGLVQQPSTSTEGNSVRNHNAPNENNQINKCALINILYGMIDTISKSNNQNITENLKDHIDKIVEFSKNVPEAGPSSGSEVNNLTARNIKEEQNDLAQPGRSNSDLSEQLKHLDLSKEIKEELISEYERNELSQKNPDCFVEIIDSDEEIFPKSEIKEENVDERDEVTTPEHVTNFNDELSPQIISSDEEGVELPRNVQVKEEIPVEETTEKGPNITTEVQSNEIMHKEPENVDEFPLDLDIVLPEIKLSAQVTKDINRHEPKYTREMLLNELLDMSITPTEEIHQEEPPRTDQLRLDETATTEPKQPYQTIEEIQHKEPECSREFNLNEFVIPESKISVRSTEDINQNPHVSQVQSDRYSINSEDDFPPSQLFDDDSKKHLDETTKVKEEPIDEDYETLFTNIKREYIFDTNEEPIYIDDDDDFEEEQSAEKWFEKLSQIKSNNKPSDYVPDDRPVNEDSNSTSDIFPEITLYDNDNINNIPPEQEPNEFIADNNNVTNEDKIFDEPINKQKTSIKKSKEKSSKERYRKVNKSRRRSRIIDDSSDEDNNEISEQLKKQQNVESVVVISPPDFNLDIGINISNEIEVQNEIEVPNDTEQTNQNKVVLPSLPVLPEETSTSKKMREEPTVILERLKKLDEKCLHLKTKEQQKKRKHSESRKEEKNEHKKVHTEKKEKKYVKPPIIEPIFLRKGPRKAHESSTSKQVVEKKVASKRKLSTDERPPVTPPPKKPATTPSGKAIEDQFKKRQRSKKYHRSDSSSSTPDLKKKMKEDRKKKLKKLAEVKNDTKEDNTDHEKVRSKPKVKVSNSRGLFLVEESEHDIPPPPKKKFIIPKKRDTTEEKLNGAEWKSINVLDTEENIVHNKPAKIARRTSTRDSEKRTSKSYEVENYRTPPRITFSSIQANSTKKYVKFSPQLTEVHEFEIENGNSLNSCKALKDAPLPSVNKKSKNRSNKKTFPAEDDAIMNIVQWVPKWLEEQKTHEFPPKVSTMRPMQMLSKFNSPGDYYHIVTPLLLLELWNSVYRDWMSPV